MALEHDTVKQRLGALLAAVVLAAGVVAGAWLVLPVQGVKAAGHDYGYVYSGAKSSSPAFINAALRDDSLIVLGSSEFSTPSSIVPQMPVNVFGAHNYGLSLMCVGEAYDQCLWDAIALGALAKDGVPRNKVAVIVGLGQFTDGGLDSQTFSVRYSQTLWDAFCRNTSISQASRDYVSRRLSEQGIDRVSIEGGLRSDLISTINGTVLGALDDLSLRQKLMEVRAGGTDLPRGERELIDFAALRAEATSVAQQRSTNNDWGIDDTFWSQALQPVLERAKDSRTSERYSNTPEYDDLACFLTVCDECGITPLVIIQPVLGPYYDHIGISAETRTAAYDHIRQVVAEHPAATLADFSDREYEPYFLYDIVHFGWTGWVDVEQALYNFALGGGA